MSLENESRLVLSEILSEVKKQEEIERARIKKDVLTGAKEGGGGAEEIETLELLDEDGAPASSPAASRAKSGGAPSKTPEEADGSADAPDVLELLDGDDADGVADFEDSFEEDDEDDDINEEADFDDNENIEMLEALLEEDTFGKATSFFDAGGADNDFSYGVFEKDSSLLTAEAEERARQEKRKAEEKEKEEADDMEDGKESEVEELEQFDEDAEGDLEPVDELEEFEEAGDGEVVVEQKDVSAPAFTFEDPLKGSDINKMAMKIEFGLTDDKESEPELEMDISAPENDIFSNYMVKHKIGLKQKAAEENVISEQDGLLLINKEAGGAVKGLDDGMKDLVNSVLSAG